jgi:cobalt/nickel transport system permease protein
MHMADALISPAVGAATWAATAGVSIYSGKKLRENLDERKIPLMGVLGAFIFAAQMINFSIPGTGSSGHLGGGMTLAILLGPHAAFVTMASILTIQALLFGDGGLLALGCNIFNLGFMTCYLAYPLIYKKIVGDRPTFRRIQLGTMVACIVGLELGAFGVVLETILSGISELPFGTFILLMLPIHLAIGIVEGVVTVAVVTFVWKARPEILEVAATSKPMGQISTRPVLLGFLVVTAITGGALSWFASTHPDGLEWSMFHASGTEELESPERGLTRALDHLQEKTALLPDYGFKTSETGDEAGDEPAAKESFSWPEVSSGKSFSGIVGAVLTMILVGLIGLSLRRYQRRG